MHDFCNLIEGVNCFQAASVCAYVPCTDCMHFTFMMIEQLLLHQILCTRNEKNCKVQKEAFWRDLGGGGTEIKDCSNRFKTAEL